MSALIQCSLSYFADHIHGIPRLVETALAALIELIFSEILVSLFWLKLKDGPYRVNLPDILQSPYFLLKLFLRLSPSYLACLKSQSPYFGRGCSDGSHWVTLPDRIHNLPILVEVVPTILAALPCKSKFIVSLLVETIRLIFTNLLILETYSLPSLVETPPNYLNPKPWTLTNIY